MGGVYDRCNVFTGVGRAERKNQVLYPWRRVLREMFHHDAALGQLFCLRIVEPQRQHVVVTELGKRLQEVAPDYGQWRAALADAFDLPVAWFPAAVPAAEPAERQEVGPAEGKGGEQGSGGMQASLDGGPTPPGGMPPVSELSALRDEDEAFLSAKDRARSFAVRMKRSVSHSVAVPGRPSPVSIMRSRPASPVAPQ